MQLCLLPFTSVRWAKHDQITVCACSSLLDYRWGNSNAICGILVRGACFIKSVIRHHSTTEPKCNAPELICLYGWILIMFVKVDGCFLIEVVLIIRKWGKMYPWNLHLNVLLKVFSKGFGNSSRFAWNAVCEWSFNWFTELNTKMWFIFVWYVLNSHPQLLLYFWCGSIVYHLTYWWTVIYICDFCDKKLYLPISIVRLKCTGWVNMPDTLKIVYNQSHRTRAWHPRNNLKPKEKVKDLCNLVSATSYRSLLFNGSCQEVQTMHGHFAKLHNLTEPAVLYSQLLLVDRFLKT